MQSLIMTGPSQTADRTEIRTLEAPRPGPGEVTIDVAYAGINFVDVMVRRGDTAYGTGWPYAPGTEVSGTVRELGPGVTTPAVGTRVAAFTGKGGLAEVAVARAEHTAPVPDGASMALAAAAPLMLATALLLLTDAARIRPGETVLVHSASGGVGSAVAQLVPALGGGLRIGTVGRPEKAESALQAGYDLALPRTEDLTETVLKATGGTGVDIILDPQGTALLETDLQLAAHGGRIVLFGNAGGGTPEPLPAAGRLMGGNHTVSGFSISQMWANAPHRAAAGLSRVLELAATGQLTVPLTELAYLEEVPETHQLLAEGRGEGKYVVRLNP
ncbi:quinone oxidoreductase family protein [Streptomyces sp. NBC_01465]|uniref:quinone oxidoreductase family protein n=1 Tax=Streptomyces sp. NBC_01465 TaxID=2903878 RepID=UPI002E3022A7|nr:zinc-binding dehydrogenase [Streptomyces sp. NBC_01465]